MSEAKRWIHGFTVLVTLIAFVESGFAQSPTGAAFVGTFLSMEDEPSSECRFTDDQCTSYQLRYRVEQVIEGELRPGEEVAFNLHLSEGAPELAKFRNALIYLELDEFDYNDEYYDGLMWEQVFPTSDGRYAICGCRLELAGKR
jgi:hypothetical protein